MHLAVEFLGREADQVLAVQFVGDAGERLGEIRRAAQFEVAAAGLFGDRRQTRIRPAAAEASAGPPEGASARRRRRRLSRPTAYTITSATCPRRMMSMNDLLLKLNCRGCRRRR